MNTTISRLLWMLLLMTALSFKASAVVYVTTTGAGTHSGTSWANAKNIYEATNPMVYNNEYWLKAGTYNNGGSQFFATFQSSVYGGFNGTETLRSQRNPAINITTLQDFTNGGIAFDYYQNCDGITFKNSPVSSVRGDTITNCIFDNSYIYLTSVGGNGNTFTDCVFKNHSGPRAAVTLTNNGKGIFTRCLFKDNSHVAPGSGYGGAVDLGADEWGEFYECTFENNTSSSYGGAISFNGSSGYQYVVNCLFRNNTSANGGALNIFKDYGPGSFVQVYQSTFVNNTATNPQGGSVLFLASDFGLVVFVNNIVWGNTGSASWLRTVNLNSTPSFFMHFETNIIQDNISSNPDVLSVDNVVANPVLNPDFTLSTCSPAINQSIQSIFLNPTTFNTQANRTTDLAGNPRIHSSSPDLGAYEWQGSDPVPPAVGITVSPSATICPGTSVTLNATGAISYSWTGGVINGGSFIPPSTTTYTVTGTAANGCTATATQTITVSALPTVGATVSPSATVCPGTSVTLNGTGASTYSWNNGVINGAVFVPGATTTYTVTGTNANGCTGTATQTVTLYSTGSIGAAVSPSAIVCAGTSVTLNGTGASSYTWSGGITNGAAFIPSASATYALTATDVNGCNGSAAWIKISAGQFHSLGIKADGTLWAWGSNNYGQLGDGSTTNSNTPVQVGTATNWADIAAGQYHSVAIKSDGTLWGWGINLYGAVGDGTSTDRHAPVQAGSATNWAKIGAGQFHSFGIKSDGTLWAWGYNFYGQLGIGMNSDSHTPVQVGTETNWVSIAGGIYHSVGMKSNGTLWSWGKNDVGQLGIGTNSNSNSPIQVGTNTNWVSIAAGYNHTMAIKSNGTLWGWGENIYGQLGNGANFNSNAPVQAGTGTNWASIAAGYNHSMGIKSDGTLWSWGNNGYGQLGDGTNASRNAPAQAGSLTNWVSVAAGYTYCMGTRTGEPLLWTWGQNTYGELGTGGNFNSNIPVQTVYHAGFNLTVTVNPLPTVSTTVSPSSSVCTGILVTLSGTGANTYSWSGGITNGAAFVPSSTNTYTVTGTGANGCTNTATQTVTVNPLPTVSITVSPSPAVCTGTSVTLGGTGANTYSWTGGVTNGVAFNPSATASYTVTGTDVHGCTGTATQTVTVNQLPGISNVTASPAGVCTGGSTTLSVAATNLPGSYTYCTSVHPSGCFIANGNRISHVVLGSINNFASNCGVASHYVYYNPSNGSTTTTLTPGSYTILVSMGTSLSQYFGAWIDYNQDGILDATEFLGASGNGGGNGTAGVTFSVPATALNGVTRLRIVGGNSVPVTASQACGASSSSVGETQDYNVTIAGGTPTVFNYSWSEVPASGTLTGTSVNPVSATNINSNATYSVLVTAITGCTASGTVSVTSLPTPTVGATVSPAATVCAGTSVTLNGTGASSYNWSGGVTNGVPFAASSTSTYTVTGTSINGCTNTATQTVTVNPSPSPTISGILSFCSGSSTTLDLGSGYDSYNWSNGATTQTINVSTAGSWSGTVTLNGCSGSSSSVTTTVNTSVTPVISGALSFCSGSSTTLDLGSGYNSYSWSNGATTQTINVSTAGSWSGTVTLNGCSGTSSSVTTTVNASVNPVISGALSFCSGSSTTLDLGTGYNTYSWSNGATTQTINVSTAGSWNGTVTLNGCSGTSSSVSTTVNANPSPVISGVLSFCSGSSTTLDLGAGYSSYSWSNGATTQTINVNTAGSWSGTVTLNGCPGTSSSAVTTVNSLPTVSFTGLAASYSASSPAVTLTGSPTGGTFSGIGISGNTFTPSSAGAGGPYTITYSYSNGNGCSNSTTHQTTVTNCSVTAKPGTINTVGGAVSVCPGMTVTYTIPVTTGATSYTWTPPTGGVLISGQGTRQLTVNYPASFTVSGTLSVVANNACGSSLPRTLAIARNNPSTPSVISGQAFGVCSGSGIPYSVVNIAGMTYNWSFNTGTASVAIGQGSNAISANFTSGYVSGTLSVTAGNGCGTSAVRSMVIKASPAVPAPITGATTVCAHQNGVAYSISPVAAATIYTWQAPNGCHISDGVTTSPSRILITTATSVTVNFGGNAGNVSVKAGNACGYSEFKSLAVAFNCRTEEEEINQFDANVYPNPSSGDFTITVQNGLNEKTVINVTDATGRKVQDIVSSVSDSQIRISNLPSGVYSAVITNGESKKVLKLIKVN